MTGQNPAMNQQVLTSDASPLSESAFRADGTFPVKIISEGWGSSGYYSRKLLAEAASRYKAGTKMFINHPSRSEAKDRPERDLNQLAGYLVKESAYWDDNGIYGPGLYQEAKALPNYADFIREAAPVIGVSHFVMGKTKQGEAAGRSGPIVESIDQVMSVDFVTTPGRGGSIGAIYESWTGRENIMAEPETKTVLLESWNEMRERHQLAEAQNQSLLKENGDLKTQITTKDSEIASLKEALAKEHEKNLLAEAGDYAAELLEKATIPDLAKTRIKDLLVRSATMKEGALDKSAMAALAESEIEYAKSLTGSTGGVKGMGATGTGSGLTLEESKKYLIESYVRSGLTEEAAKKAVGA